jgi:uncharacterized protein YjbI with pentapeptide repeats
MFSHGTVEVLTMRSLKRDLWKAGIFITWAMLLLVLTIWISVSAVHAQQATSGSDMLGAITVQATPTADATMTALQKEQLTQQVAGQQRTWGNWLWSNAATILSGFLSTLVIVIGALFGLWRWFTDRRDAQNKELQDRQNEREKRAEERFQSAVEGLGDEKEGARIGAAILLRTFLRPSYEQFYMQVFDLATANLRLGKVDPNIPEPLDTLRQALITVFKESFPLTRDRLKEENSQFRPQSLIARGIQLDNAYLSKADLKQVWMPQATLRNTDLSGADLRDANLTEADLRDANLTEADLRGASLSRADLRGVKLYKANLSGVSLDEVKLNKAMLAEANLSGATFGGAMLNLYGINLNGADLRMADLSGADLNLTAFDGADLAGAILNNIVPETARSFRNTNLRGVKGLTEEQLAFCKAKGAIINEDAVSSSPPLVTPTISPSQDSDELGQSASPAQENLSASTAGENNSVLSQPDPAS